MKTNDLEVLSARWGEGDAWVDVTEQLGRIAARFGPFAPITFGNRDIGVDPCPGRRKMLQAKLRHDGREAECSILEFEMAPLVPSPSAYYYATGMNESPIHQMLLLPHGHGRGELEEAVADAGLSGFSSYPGRLCNRRKGLRIWQYPNQFAPYLIRAAAERPRSYLEIGTMEGGTFAFTTEYLRRFCGLERSLAVDVAGPSPFLLSYARLEPIASLLKANSQSERETVRRQGGFDMALVDGDHTYHGCLSDILLCVEMGCRIIAVHDIVDQYVNSAMDSGSVGACGSAWRDWSNANPDWDHFEIVNQYREVAGTWMGIGLAIRKPHLTSSPV